MENALARMAPSARSVGRGPTGHSTFTRRLKLWATVRARTSHRPYYGRLSLVGFSSSGLLRHMSFGLGGLLFWNRSHRWPRFRHETTHHQSITADQLADNRDDATGKATQHAWTRTLRGAATSHVRLG